MKFFYSTKFSKMARELPLGIRRKARKKEDLFKDNMFHPSLNIEKLSPKALNYWSFRIDRTYRIVFHFEKDVVTFLYIGHHKDIYRFDF